MVPVNAKEATTVKMSQEAFQTLQAAVAQVDTPEVRAAYAAQGLSHMRYRWDALHAARRAGLLPERFVVELYDKEDLNDDHIDTALRRAVSPF
jgi:hypothetical protein